jgi:hypothetical protein
VRPRRLVFIAIVITGILVVGVAIRFVVFPHTDPIGKPDVVVVLDAPRDGEKFNVARKILAASPQSTVLYSAGDGQCDRLRHIAAHLVCFLPRPGTTQGEARYAAAYAKAHHDATMAVVARRAQVSRARIRFSRCWHGSLAMVEEPMSVSSSIAQVPYQILATIKAETLQRGC